MNGDPTHVVVTTAADADESSHVRADPTPCDEAQVILWLMEDRQTGLRALAQATGIGKSRLGGILHRDRTKRQPMTLLEYRALLAFFAIDPLDALIRICPVDAADRYRSTRYATLLAMLCEMFRGLAGSMIDAVDQLDGVDGTEVRLEWAPALRQAVVRRVVHEINAVAARRAALSDFNILG